MTAISSQTIKVNTQSGDYDAYLARPQGDSVGAVVVIQEIFGVNADIRGIADWYAEQGYLALAPDLFWRVEPNVSLTDQTEEEWQKAFALMNAFDGDLGVQDIQAAIDTLRGDSQCNGKVGTVGFCLGGRMAYLAATRTNADANVGYYGVGIQDLVGEAENISAPLVLHVAGLDEFVPAEAQAAIHAGLDAHPQVTVFDYAEQDHAFARIGGAHYDAAASEAAHQRTLAVFADAL
jgi:carboxymethylenebutenolidase